MLLMTTTLLVPMFSLSGILKSHSYSCIFIVGFLLKNRSRLQFQVCSKLHERTVKIVSYEIGKERNEHCNPFPLWAGIAGRARCQPIEPMVFFSALLQIKERPWEWTSTAWVGTAFSHSCQPAALWGCHQADEHCSLLLEIKKSSIALLRPCERPSACASTALSDWGRKQFQTFRW